MSSLGLAAKQGARSLFMAQLAKFFVNAVSLVLLSRLLTPRDYGYAAIAVAIVGVGEVVRDLGLSTAAIRTPELSDGQRDVLFWVNTALGLALAIVIWLLSPWLGTLFGEPLMHMARWLGVVFVSSGIAAQYRAGLNRSLRFGVIAAVEVVAAVTSLIVSVVLAASGAGYWSIVGQYITSAVLVALLFILADRWLPRLPRRHQGVKRLFQFGLSVSFSQVLAYVGNNIDTLVIGYFSAPTTVGLYNRAQQLVMAPINQLKAPANTVALPALSRVQDDGKQFVHFLLRGQLLIGYTVLPIAAILGATSGPTVRIVLGDQWVSAAPVVSILVIAAALQQMSSVANWTFMAKGLGRQLSWYSLISVIVKLIVVTILAQYGLIAVALGYVVSVSILWPVSIYWAMRSVHLPMGKLVKQGAALFSLAMIAGIVGYGLVTLIDVKNNWVALVLGVAGIVGTYGLSTIIPSSRRDLKYVIMTMKEAIVGRRD